MLLENRSQLQSPYISKVLFVPQTLFGLTFAFIAPASLEFTIAQAPVHSRGVMVGMWLASFGIGHIINIYLKFPFGCHNELICTSFYYYLTKSIIVLLILIVFVILAKRYKYCVRENEVNIHQIVDDHYQRYLEQGSWTQQSDEYTSTCSSKLTQHHESQ